MSRKRKKTKKKAKPKQKDQNIQLKTNEKLDEKLLESLKEENKNTNPRYGIFSIIWAISIFCLIGYGIFSGISNSNMGLEEIDYEEKMNRFSDISLGAFSISLLIYFHFAVLLISYSLKKKDKDKFATIRRKYKLSLLASLLAMACLFVAFIFPNGFFENPQSRIEGIVVTLSTVLASGLLLSMFQKPKLVFNKWLTTIGTVIIWILILTLFKGIIEKLISNSAIIILILILIFGISEFLRIKNGALNFMEYGVAKFTEPKKLLFAIGGKEEEIRNEKRVIVELEKRIKQDDWGYLNKMNERLISEFGGKESIWLKIFKYGIVVVVFKIIDSLGEGIIQDLWLEDLKRFLCETIGILCK